MFGRKLHEQTNIRSVSWLSKYYDGSGQSNDNLVQSNKTHRHSAVEPTVMDIDKVDKKILGILQVDGRAALSEIARRLDMGTATIHERTRALEEEGYIRNYRAVLDPELLGRNEVGFIRIKTIAGRSSEVAERLVEETAIQEIHELTGDADLLLKVRVTDRKEMTELLRDIGRYEGVNSTATDMALRSVKEEHTLRIDE